MIEYATLCGLDPWPLSLRELVAAAEFKRTEDWDRVSETIAILGSIFSGRRISRDDVHPFRQVFKTGTDPAIVHSRLKAKQHDARIEAG